MDFALAPLPRLADEALQAVTRPAEPLRTSENATETAAPTAAPDASAAVILVSSDCASDGRAFCGREANVLALLREVQDGVAPAKLAEAMRSVHLCLARHADALSPGCVEMLVTNIVGSDVVAATATPQLSAMAAGPDDDSTVEINIYYSRHHRGAAGHAFRAGGGALSASHLSASDVGHSVLWVLALPFFLLGLYVSAKQGVLYARRRREERRIECKQQYLPVH